MKNHQDISQSIYQEIKTANNILLISHKKPDGDTLGSNLALVNLLKKKKKNITSFCADPIPENLQFLPNSHIMTDDHKMFIEKYDLVITLDCSNLEYAGVDGLITALPLGYRFINIDHHVSNPGYADINLVIHEASSTAEVLYRLFIDWDIEWDEDIANSLSCGLVTDTNGFKNPATNYLALSAASDLINKGANVYKTIQATVNQNNVGDLRLWGRALERLHKVDHYNLIYTWMTIQDFEECQVDASAAEGIANFLHILKEGKIILVLREGQDNTVKGSLRTTSNVDLTKLAGLFGGGGHKKASGFSFPGKLVYDKNNLKVI